MDKNNTSKSTKKRYSPQFKDQAVERAEKDGVAQVPLSGLIGLRQLAETKRLPKAHHTLSLFSHLAL